MGEGVRLLALCAVLTQHLGDLPRRSVPARGDADPALPETRTIQVIAGFANGLGLGVVEKHFNAAGGTHADRLPALIGDGHARLIQRHRDQLLAILGIPRGEQRMAEHRRAGAPGLAPVEAHHVPGRSHLHPSLRWFSRPHAPSAARCGRTTELFDDRQCVGVAFVEFAQAQIMSADFSQTLKTLQRAAAAW